MMIWQSYASCKDGMQLKLPMQETRQAIGGQNTETRTKTKDISL